MYCDLGAVEYCNRLVMVQGESWFGGVGSVCISGTHEKGLTLGVGNKVLTDSF
jgi:hypothetical protein